MSDPVHILIVDDEPNIRLVFRTALDPCGYAVDEAKDGREALERLEEHPRSLVLLDLQMPGMGGMEVLRTLRDREDETPVIIVTAYGTIPDAVDAMKLGAIDFLSKPLRPETLRRVVGDVLARHTETTQDSSWSAQPVGPVSVTIAAPCVDLTAAKRALNRREFDKAAALLEEALDLTPDSPEANTLAGVLYESRGQDHSAYHAYKAALTADPHYGPALENLRRYCERSGLDFHNKAINPGAQG